MFQCRELLEPELRGPSEDQEELRRRLSRVRGPANAPGSVDSTVRVLHQRYLDRVAFIDRGFWQSGFGVGVVDQVHPIRCETLDADLEPAERELRRRRPMSHGSSTEV